MAGGGVMNILEEFYYGNVNPQENLGGKEKHLFSQLMNAQSEILDTEARERFIEGWKLGASFMIDTFLVPRYSPINGVCEE